MSLLAGYSAVNQSVLAGPRLAIVTVNINRIRAGHDSLVLYEQQNEALWDTGSISHGLVLLRRPCRETNQVRIIWMLALFSGLV